MANSNPAGSLAIGTYKVYVGGAHHYNPTPDDTAANATGVDVPVSNDNGSTTIAANTTYSVTCINVGTGGDSAASSAISLTTLPVAPSLSTSSTANTATTVNFDVGNGNTGGTLVISSYKVYVGGVLNSTKTPNDTAADSTGNDTQITVAANTTHAITVVNVNSQSKESAASSSQNEITFAKQTYT